MEGKKVAVYLSGILDNTPIFIILFILGITNDEYSIVCKLEIKIFLFTAT